MGQSSKNLLNSVMPTSLLLIAVYVASSRARDALSIFGDAIAAASRALPGVPKSSSSITRRGVVGANAISFSHLLSATFKTKKHFFHIQAVPYEIDKVKISTIPNSFLFW